MLLDKEHTKQNHNHYLVLIIDFLLGDYFLCPAVTQTRHDCDAVNSIVFSSPPASQVVPVSKYNRQTYIDSKDKAPRISNIDNRRRLTVNFWFPINLYCREATVYEAIWSPESVGQDGERSVHHYCELHTDHPIWRYFTLMIEI